MDEFDIYLESAGSMNIYSGNTMAAFRNLLAHPIHLEGDWRVALAEIIFPTSIENITTTDFFIYTPKTPYDNTPVLSSEGGGVIKREDWSDNAKFEAGEYQTISSIPKQLDKATETKKPLNSADYVEDNIEIRFKSRYGISVRDRSLFDVLGIQGVPDTNRGGYYIGTNYKVANMKQPIKNTYPPDLTVGTNMFFVNTNIIEHQHVAGVKSPLLRIIENTKQVQDGKLLNTSTTAHRVFTELQFEKLITSTIEEIQIELMSITGQKVPFVGTGLVALTQISKISINGTILRPTGTTTQFLRTCKTTWKWFRVISSWCWTSSFTIRQKVFAPRCQVNWQRFFITEHTRVA